MKKLLLFLAVLLPLSLHAALPDYSVFRGTNEVLVTTNPSTGKVIIGPATAISQTASNAAKSLMVWTNSNNQTRLSRYPAHNTNVHRQIDLQYDVASDDGAQLFGLNLSLNDDNSQSDDVVGIFSAVNLQPNGGDRALYNELGVWGLVASVDIGLGSAITNGETVALYGDCSSGATLQYGVGAHVTPPFNGQTNVGVASSIDMRFAPSALAVGAYLELTPVITNPSFEPAILLLDNRTTNSAPLIVGRTNNGSTVYRLNRDGSQLVAGPITNTALLPSKFVSTGPGTNLTSSAYSDADIATALALTPTNRILTINGTANQIAVDTSAQNLAGNRTWTLSLPSNLNIIGLTNQTTTDSAGQITAYGGMKLPTLTVTRLLMLNSSGNPTNAPALTAGQYLTFDGSGIVASNLPPSSAGPTTNAPPYTASITSGLGSTNILIDMLALGPTNTVRATLTANAGIMFSNVIDGMAVTLELIQDATGNRTVSTNATWGFNLRFGIDVTGFGQSTNASTKDLIRFVGSGTNALVVGNLRGFAL